jgi:hypothetical protein
MLNPETHLEDLLYIDRMTRRAKDQRGMHGFRKPFGLLRDLFLFVPRKSSELIVLGPYQDRDRRLFSSSAETKSNET